MDLTGAEVASTNAKVSLPTGGSQACPLDFTKPGTGGTYVLKVTLAQKSKTATVFTTLVQVRGHQVYLPLVLRNIRNVTRARWGAAWTRLGALTRQATANDA